MTAIDPDPRGLIGEAFRMDNLNPPECRSIFLDWMLGAPQGADIHGVVRMLLHRHRDAPAEHPMHDVLRSALQKPPPAIRRGGRRGRAV